MVRDNDDRGPFEPNGRTDPLHRRHSVIDVSLQWPTEAVGQLGGNSRLRREPYADGQAASFFIEPQRMIFSLSGVSPAAAYAPVAAERAARQSPSSSVARDPRVQRGVLGPDAGEGCASAEVPRPLDREAPRSSAGVLACRSI